jgi:predicted aspartyl protease
MDILHYQGNVIIFHALIDCGATGYALINENYTQHHHLPFQPFKSSRNLTILGGRCITSGIITHIV